MVCSSPTLTAYHLTCLVNVGCAFSQRTHCNSIGRTFTQSGVNTGEPFDQNHMLRDSRRTAIHRSLQETKRGTFAKTAQSLHSAFDTNFVQNQKTTQKNAATFSKHLFQLGLIFSCPRRANWLVFAGISPLLFVSFLVC